MSCAVSLSKAVKCLLLLLRQPVLCSIFDNCSKVSLATVETRVLCSIFDNGSKVSLATVETMCLVQYL